MVTGEPVLLEEVDALVLASGHRRGFDLHDALSVVGCLVRAVGDCLSPRTVEEAILEGMQAGFGL